MRLTSPRKPIRRLTCGEHCRNEIWVSPEPYFNSVRSTCPSSGDSTQQRKSFAAKPTKTGKNWLFFLDKRLSVLFRFVNLAWLTPAWKRWLRSVNYTLHSLYCAQWSTPSVTPFFYSNFSLENSGALIRLIIRVAKDTFVWWTPEILDLKSHLSIVELILRSCNPTPNLKGEDSPSLSCIVIARGSELRADTRNTIQWCLWKTRDARQQNGHITTKIYVYYSEDKGEKRRSYW